MELYLKNQIVTQGFQLGYYPINQITCDLSELEARRIQDENRTHLNFARKTLRSQIQNLAANEVFEITEASLKDYKSSGFKTPEISHFVEDYEVRSQLFLKLGYSYMCNQSDQSTYKTLIFVKHKSENRIRLRSATDFFTILNDLGNNWVNGISECYKTKTVSDKRLPFLFKAATIEIPGSHYLREALFGKYKNQKIENRDLKFKNDELSEMINKKMREIHGKFSNNCGNEKGISYSLGKLKGNRRYRYISSILEDKLTWTCFSDVSDIDILDSDIQSDWIERLLFANRFGRFRLTN